MWSQVWEGRKAKQKQYEPTYPVFGLHREWEGDDKKEVGNTKRKQWTDDKKLYGPKATIMVFVMLHKIRNEGKNKKSCRDECSGVEWIADQLVGSRVGQLVISECEPALSNTPYIHWHSQPEVILLLFSQPTFHTEDTYFFCSFLFFSAGPPRVPIPKLSLVELSDSGVPARNTTVIFIKFCHNWNNQ